jgi:DNA-binding transcriptional MerR regulator
MAMMTGFEWTRKEVLQLTGLTLSNLEYLDKIGLIQPIRIGLSKKPIVRYSWQHIVALRAYAEMRKQCSLQAFRKALDDLQLEDPWLHISKKQLVAFNNEIYWIPDDPTEYAQLIRGKERQVVFSITGNELLQGLWSNGENKIVDFAKRAKEKPCPRISA